MTGQPRLRDVAERAGVSIRTVSNVVNGYARVSDDKRERVEQAVAELGYRPNVLARNLKSGRSGLLALIVPEVDVPYFAELARAVVTTAREFGYTVVIDQTDGQPDRERELIQREGMAALFDGIILSPLALSLADLPERDPARPLVLLGERIAGSEFDHVAIDNVAAAREATEHLLALGRRRIAAVGDQPYETGETAQLRTTGYVQAHRERGIPVDRSLIVPRSTFHFTDGADAMAELLRHPDGPPDALFCYNDLVAIGAMRVALAAGLRVPDEIAIVGFDDIDAAQFQTPSLTTVAPDRDAIARKAIERIAALFEDDGSLSPEEIFVDHRLVIRESTIGSGPASAGPN